MARAIDITGLKFHKLTVVESKGKHPKSRHMTWFCVCDCGNQVVVDGTSLRAGTTKSCGCRKEEAARERLSKEPRIRSAKVMWRKSGRTDYSDGDLTFEKWLELSQLPCHYCGRSSQESNVCNAYKRKGTKCSLDNITDGEFRYNGLDRVDNSKPHNMDNVVPCCKTCNSAKMATGYSEFLDWIKQVYDHISNK